jgi:hypothetical protein
MKRDPQRLILRSRRIRMKVMSGSRLIKRGPLRLTLRPSRIRIKADAGKVSETDFGTRKDPDEGKRQDKCLYMEDP